MPSIFFDHNGMKQEINNTMKTRKLINRWKLNNALLKYQWVKNYKIN